jgi:hypothetical protein
MNGWQWNPDEPEILVARIDADSSALLGANPIVTYWEMSHGSGGGGFDVPFFVPKWDLLWKEAGNLVQWQVKTTRFRRKD